MRDYLLSKEFFAGLATIIIGGMVVWVASGYNFGTARRMGPGFFPVVLGTLMCVVGLLILLSAMRQHEPMPNFAWRPLLCLPLAITAFALLVPRFGFAPAGLITVVLTGMAERYFSIANLLVLTLFLVPGVWLIFAVGLNVPIRLFAWRM